MLEKILTYKAEEVTQRKQKTSLIELQKACEKIPPPLDFLSALKHAISQRNCAIIAELKKASPSAGIIRPDYDPEKIAQQYLEAGATCLSILTDNHFFQGNSKHLKLAKAVARLPCLRKDFIIDEYQIFESRLLGADCILLIVAALSRQNLVKFSEQARKLGLTVLMEVHSRSELTTALELEPSLIGINNRNLNTFKTDLNTTHQLMPLIPKEIIAVSESGIHTNMDVQMLQQQQVQAFLVGEAFMRTDNPGNALRALFFPS